MTSSSAQSSPEMKPVHKTVRFAAEAAYLDEDAFTPTSSGFMSPPGLAGDDSVDSEDDNDAVVPSSFLSLVNDRLVEAAVPKASSVSPSDASKKELAEEHRAALAAMQALSLDATQASSTASSSSPPSSPSPSPSSSSSSSSSIHTPPSSPSSSSSTSQRSTRFASTTSSLSVTPSSAGVASNQRPGRSVHFAAQITQQVFSTSQAL